MEDVKLTPAQEQQIVDFWNGRPTNPPSIAEITELIFGPGKDGRSAEGRCIKQFLLSKQLKAKTTGERENKTQKIELSEAHKQYIASNAQSMKALEMAKTIFSNETLVPLSAEVRAIAEYIKHNVKNAYAVAENDDIPLDDYHPPKTWQEAFDRVNEYLNNSLVEEKLTQAQKRGFEVLVNYLHNYNFLYQMNTYDTETDRKLCEDSFARHTYDKPDLSQEEVDQYIQLANQVVLGYKSQRRKNILESQLEHLSTSNGAENVKISIGLTESIGKASTEYHQCIDRQKKLLESLTLKRSARLDKQIKSTASIINLVHEWKQREFREQYMEMAKREQKAIDEQVEKFVTMDDIKARILGLTKNEILNG